MNPEKTAVVVSVSANTPWARLTVPNTLQYCQRHGFAFMARSLPYDKAVRDLGLLLNLLDFFEVVWSIDADAVITNHAIRPCDLGLMDGMNVCEEGLWSGVRVNCGSVFWMGSGAKKILHAISGSMDHWVGDQFVWQGWINKKLNDPEIYDLVHAHPGPKFNSCHHGSINHWQPGHFVYHPCGASQDREGLCQAVLSQVVH